MHEERECLWRTQGNHGIKVCSAVLGTGTNGGYWEQLILYDDTPAVRVHESGKKVCLAELRYRTFF